MNLDLLILYSMLECRNYNMHSFEPDFDTTVDTLESFNEWYEQNRDKSFDDIDKIKKSMIIHINTKFI